MKAGGMRTSRALKLAARCLPATSSDRSFRHGGLKNAIAAFRWTMFVYLLATSSVAGAQKAPIEAGQIAYLRECAGCHGVSADGNGPDAAFLEATPTDLRHSPVLDVYRDEDLEARIREGKALALEVRPEALRQHAQETAALYEFLARLPGTDWKKVAMGEYLYLSRCLPCHDRYGHPAPKPVTGVRQTPRDLADPTFQRDVRDEELHVLARHGKEAMPALVPRLREDEVVPLVSFIRQLSPGYEMYDRFCARCHGVEGRGAEGPSAEPGAPRFAFDSSYFSTHDREQVQKAVWHMLRENEVQMPHFSDSLGKDELAAILAYLRSLRQHATPDSTPPAKP